MFVQETKLLQEIISKLPGKKEKSVLDIGSSSKEYRCKIQPHIDQFLFKPLRDTGCKISYLDKKNEDGIDIVADLNDPSFNQMSQNDKFDLIICSNILEHVLDRDLFMNNLLTYAKKNSIIIITVPYKYFKHNDPIDTMFRPSPQYLMQWLKKFMDFEIIYSEILTINEKRYYLRKKRIAKIIPITTSIDYWRYFFKAFHWKVTCLVIKL